MSETVIGMGEMALGVEGEMLTMLGLGSCVGVMLYDPVAKIGGGAHIMLPTSEGVPPPPRTVLIADADIGVRMHLKRVIATANCTIVGEATVQDEALKLYRECKPQVTLVSAFLPPQNGPATIASLLHIDKDANAIIVSPALDKTTIITYLRQGAVEVLTNPFTETKVHASVEYGIYRRQLKYADKAIPILIERMKAMGADKSRIVAKIAGGAHLFPTLEDSEALQIGKRNIEAVRQQLQQHEIPLLAHEVGANIGRTVRLTVGQSVIHISTKEGVKTI
jgi:chemotaxis receptor (MCP) glutamine deamidase CheD